jgi:hypothetical protein
MLLDVGFHSAHGGFSSCCPDFTQNRPIKIKGVSSSADKGSERTPRKGADMEIAPIAGIRLVSSLKPSAAEPAEIHGVVDIALARAEDDSYSGNARKGSGGQDDEESAQEEQLPEEDGLPTKNSGGLSLFA